MLPTAIILMNLFFQFTLIVCSHLICRAILEMLVGDEVEDTSPVLGLWFVSLAEAWPGFLLVGAVIAASAVWWLERKQPAASWLTVHIALSLLFLGISTLAVIQVLQNPALHDAVIRFGTR